MKNIKKLKVHNSKKNLIKIWSTTVLAIVAAMSGVITVNAAVDFSGGIEQVTNNVTSQAKAIMGTIFGFVAIIALAFTVAKAIKAGLAYHRSGEPVNATPIVAGGIATIVAGLASSATFFGWFGL